ncbi:MAG: DUF938 domain-containing protein [Porticoccaceae bacterium]
MAVKPFSQACENNRQPILDVLLRVFADCRKILEIGSGTGQHAVYCAPRLPHLSWQTSDLHVHHAGIQAWLAECPAANLLPPLDLNVDQPSWPVDRTDGVFTANTCHIMAWTSVVNLFTGAGRTLAPGGVLAIYGPFNYGGRFTSDSNARFDAWLKQQAPHQGIRDFEAVNELAESAGFALHDDHAMPANNRLLVWRRS